jgi:hypothetical protein
MTIHTHGLVPLQSAGGIVSVVGGGRPREPKYGLHSLGQAAASLFSSREFRRSTVQVQMGHSVIAITFDTYGHLFPTPEDDQGAMRQLQARLVGWLTGGAQTATHARSPRAAATAGSAPAVGVGNIEVSLGRYR